MIKAAIFDLDGTLLDTIEGLKDSMNFALNFLGFEGHDTEAYKYFVGKGVEVLAQRVLKIKNPNKEIVKKLIALMDEKYAEIYSNKTYAYKNIHELLRCLNQRNIKLAVLSNKKDDFTKKMIKEYFPDIFFEVVLGSRDNIPKKPDPKSAFEIAKILSIAPSNIAFLGDTEVDIQTAKSASMISFGVLWGFRKKEELLDSNYLLEDPLDFLTYCNN